MEGQPSQELRGIIPRSFDYIFSSIQTYPDRQYLVRASFLEIYNESIRDLLAPGASKHDASKGLELRENKDRGIFVAGLQSEVVESVPAMLHLLQVLSDTTIARSDPRHQNCIVPFACDCVQKGNGCRSTGATLMNQDSSRSHSIFTITVECVNVDGGDHVRVGKLNLVDLAGSERQSKTGATGDRFTEAKNINLSLSALGNVITALVDGQSGEISSTLGS
jgi:kinesin family protein 3/17